MNTINPDKLYRSGEVRDLIGCGNTKFWSLAKSGAFECRKLGGSVVVPGYSIRAFIESLPLVNEPKAAA